MGAHVIIIDLVWIVVVCVRTDASHDLHPLRAVTFIHRTKLVAATTHSIGPNCLKFHTNVKTFLKPAVWAPFPLRFIDVTAPIRNT